MTVLIVEADARDGARLAEVLFPAGVESTVFTSGEDMLEQLEALAPELVLVGARLPGMDCAEVVRRVKATQPPGRMWPVMVTGDVGLGAGFRVRAFAAGCDDLVTRPVEDDELRARVRALLSRRREHEALVRANRQLADVHRKKQELAALLVHDLRNPLATILGNVELVEDELTGASDNVKECLTDCRQLANRALGLVGTLLDVEELEEGMLDPHPVDVGLTDFMPACARFLKADLRARRLTLDIRVESPDLEARFDPDLVGRAIENLLDNSIRYSPVAGTVLASVTREGNALVFRVGNSGPPVPTAERGRIFDKYYRIEARRAGARANRGLGLYFCRLVAQAHRGGIDVEEAAAGPGTMFAMRIPFSPKVA